MEGVHTRQGIRKGMMSENPLGPPIIIDNGSHTIKAGFSGEETPIGVFPPVIARQEDKKYPWMPYKRPFVGDDAESIRGSGLSVECPIECGVVSNWDYMETIWAHTFHEVVRADPEHHSVLLTDAQINPNRKKDREKMAEIMFETFNCPAMYVTTPAILSMYASGRTTGIVCHLGHGQTHIVPVHEGFPQTRAVETLDFGGRDLTGLMANMLKEKDLLKEESTRIRMRLGREIKEKLCYVALDFEQEKLSALRSLKEETTFELPDGNTISIDTERFRCPEALFKPSYMEKGTTGIHKATHKSIMTCDGILEDMFANVVLSGGSAMYPGMADRMQRELAELAPDASKVNVITPKDGALSVWSGGSILADLSTFQCMWFSKREYEASGAHYINVKCITES